MKFETYAHNIVPDHQLNFHKDMCKDAWARGVNAHTRDEMLFTDLKSDLKWLRYDLNRDIIITQAISGYLAGGLLVS